MKLALLALFALCATAHAQETGGSIGGGSFDDEPEPSAPEPSYAPSEPSYQPSYAPSEPSYPPSYAPAPAPTPPYGSTPTPDYAYATGGDDHDATWIYVVIAGVMGLTTLGGAALFRKAGRARPEPRKPARADVTVLYFGLDARVRPFVQRELDRIAKTADTWTKPGLTRTLNEVALMLRRIRDAWVYGGAHNEDLGNLHAIEALFQRHAAAARATFTHETVRAAGGNVTLTSAPRHPRRTEEGDGLVLVTVVVAAREELFTVRQIGDGDDLRRALEVLSSLTANLLLAVEIVWTPSAPDDRMSSVELEARLGDAIFPITGAMVGKTVCGYCGGPFPKELMSCPHCGAPARAAG